MVECERRIGRDVQLPSRFRWPCAGGTTTEKLPAPGAQHAASVTFAVNSNAIDGLEKG